MVAPEYAEFMFQHTKVRATMIDKFCCLHIIALMLLPDDKFYFLRIVVGLLVIVHCYNESFMGAIRVYHRVNHVLRKSANAALAGRICSYVSEFHDEEVTYNNCYRVVT